MTPSGMNATRYSLGKLLPICSSGTRQELHPCVAHLETSLFQMVPEEQTRISSPHGLYRGWYYFDASVTRAPERAIVLFPGPFETGKFQDEPPWMAIWRVPEKVTPLSAGATARKSCDLFSRIHGVS
jgi:hypothetical protein